MVTEGTFETAFGLNDESMTHPKPRAYRAGGFFYRCALGLSGIIRPMAC